MHSLLARFPISRRLHLVTLITVASLAGLLVYGYVAMSERFEQDRMNQLRAITEVATSIAAADEAAERTGRMTREAAQRHAAEAIRAIRYQGSEYIWINDMAPRMVMHPFRPELEGKDLSGVTDPSGLHLFTAFVSTVRTQGAGVVSYLWPRPGAEQPIQKMSYVQGFAPWGWVIGTGVYVDDLIAERRRLAFTLAGIGIVVSASVGCLIWLLGRSVSQPARVLTESTRLLAAGDLAGEIPGRGRRDEFGEIADALVVLRNNARERARLEANVAAERGIRDRRQTAMERHTRDFSCSVAGVMQQLADAADAMRKAATRVTTAVGQTRTRATSTAAGASEAAGNLGSVASAAEEMSASINEINSQVARVTAAASDAAARTTETDTKVTSLVAAAERIGDVVSLIATIAGQTNLLALNATIEAARAGDAGKGFAVVAGEVKVLAAQTARATDEIRSQIGAIRDATSSAASAVHGVSQAVQEMNAIATAIGISVEQQAGATREIAGSVQLVSVSTGQTTLAMQEVCDVVVDADTAGIEVSTAAEDVGKTARRLSEEMDHFLRAMESTDDRDRRSYDRVPGNGIKIDLDIAGQPSLHVEVVDLSRGGVALASALSLPPGTEAMVRHDSAATGIGARVARSDGRILGLAFHQDPKNTALADALIDRAARGGVSAAAA